MTEHNPLFEEYFDSVFKMSNTFSETEYNEHCRAYDALYGKLLPLSMDASILDLGCGAGHFLYYCKTRNYTNAAGIDISPQQVSYCRSHIGGQVTQADAFEFLKDNPERYDLIVSHDVLEHIPKQRVIELLQRVWAALKPGGMFFLKTPNMGNPCALRLRYADFTHEIGFTDKSLHQVLWIAGFRDIQVLPTPDQGLLNKVVAGTIRFFIRKIMWYQGFVAPEILTPVLIGVVKK